MHNFFDKSHAQEFSDQMFSTMNERMACREQYKMARIELRVSRETVPNSTEGSQSLWRRTRLLNWVTDGFLSHVLRWDRGRTVMQMASRSVPIQ